MRVLLGLFFLFPLMSFAQEMFNFLSPASPMTSFEVEGLYFPLSKVERGPDKNQVFRRSVTVQQRLFKDEKSVLSVGAKYQELDQSGESMLLRDYYNQQASLAYKRQYDENLFWLATVSYGSASDRPFKNSRDNTLGANYIQKFTPQWFGILNYSNNRTFLNHIPLPGFFYVKEMTADRALIIGFPVIYWMRPLYKKWSLKFLSLLPWVHHLKFIYNEHKALRPYLSFEQSPQSFFRHDRDSTRNRVFWFERRLGAGLEGKMKNLRYDLSGGLSFDREFFEATNFSQEKENLLNLENSFYISLKIAQSF